MRCASEQFKTKTLYETFIEYGNCCTDQIRHEYMHNNTTNSATHTS